MPVHQKEETKNEVQARNMNGRVTSTPPPHPGKSLVLGQISSPCARLTSQLMIRNGFLKLGKKMHCYLENNKKNKKGKQQNFL